MNDIAKLAEPVRHFIEKMLAGDDDDVLAAHKLVAHGEPREPVSRLKKVGELVITRDREEIELETEEEIELELETAEEGKWGTARNYARLVLLFAARGGRSVEDARDLAQIADPVGAAEWEAAFGEAAPAGDVDDDADPDDDAIDAGAGDDDDAGDGEEDDGDDDAVKKGAEPMSFEAHVSEIMKRDKCSRFVALDKVANEQPEALEAYQHEGIEKVEKIAEAARPPGPCPMQVVFDQVVAKIASEHKLSRFDAMEKATRDHPELIAGMRAA